MNKKKTGIHNSQSGMIWSFLRLRFFVLAVDWDYAFLQIHGKLREWQKKHQKIPFFTIYHRKSTQ
jgi:hypothetical protein